MTSYDKKLHKYDKIGDDKIETNTDSRPLKPEYYGQETSRYAPGTLESNDPKTDDQPPYRKTSKEKYYDDEEDID